MGVQHELGREVEHICVLIYNICLIVRLNSCEKGKSEEWVEGSNEMVRISQNSMNWV